MSEFSEQSSMELDLEFDLYDCDLNNVSNQPGSMFAHQNMFYDFYDFEDEEEEELGITFYCLIQHQFYCHKLDIYRLR